MNKQEMISAIYEKIADKTLSFGCKFKILDKEKTFIKINGYGLVIDYDNGLYDKNILEKNIIGHPVMINRIEFVLEEKDYLKIRETISKNELLLPIDEWNEKSIELLYNLINLKGK